MDRTESLSHSKWECKYHVVFIPKRRRKMLFGAVRKSMGEVFHRLAGQKESRVEEGHLMPDHVHMLIAIPPKYAVSAVIGFIKGEERHPRGAGVRRTEAELRGAALLGAGVFHLDRRSGRASDSGLHPAADAADHQLHQMNLWRR